MATKKTVKHYDRVKFFAFVMVIIARYCYGWTGRGPGQMDLMNN